MINNKYIKIGQWFKGNRNGAKFQIIDITQGLKQEPDKVQQSPTQQENTYIYVQDEAGRISHTNAQTFQRLQIKPIKNKGADHGAII